MTGAVGGNAYINFKGTDITGDFRELKTSEKTSLVDASAGSDAARTWLATLIEGDASYTAVWQDTTSGDAVYVLCAPEAEGSLIIGPDGSTGGKLKITVNAIVESTDITMPYDDLKKLDIKIRYSGAPSKGTF